jgi:hypothetical protein
LIEQLSTASFAPRSDILLLIVDDGSVLPLENAIGEEFRSAFKCRIITLKRNLGQARAIAIGLASAVNDDLADIVVIMDADGEDNPSDISRLITALGDQDCMTFAVAARRKRSEQLLFRMLYPLYRVLFVLLTGHEIRFGNFSAMPIAAARRLTDMSELWLSLPATMLRSHLRIVMVPTDRGSRLHGESHMNIISLGVLGFSAVAVFAERALMRIILGALAVLGVAAVASLTAVALKVVGMATPGWVTTVLSASVIILISVAILCLVGLFLSILGGVHTVPAPSATYRSHIARVTNFDGSVWSHPGEPNSIPP